MRNLLTLLAVLGTGCTTLGPMPAVTGQPVVPAPRPGAEAQVAKMPGYFLSSAVQEDPEGAAVSQASVMLEPGELIGVPGLSAGGRWIGGGDDGAYVEPMVRYRGALDDKGVFSAGAVVYGSHQEGKSKSASVEATRGGAEVAIDARVTPESKWVELHMAGSLGLTSLDAKGRYCLDAAGRFGVDCPDQGPIDLVDATADGLFPTAGGAFTLDMGRHLGGILHGGRIAVHGAVGKMPRVVSGEQTDAKTYTSAGVSITLGVGATE